MLGQILQRRAKPTHTLLSQMGHSEETGGPTSIERSGLLFAP